MIEVTDEMKSADMNIIPHVFPKAEAGSIVLLDPCATEKLLDLRDSGESITKLIIDGDLIMSTDYLNCEAPNGVKIIPIKWR